MEKFVITDESYAKWLPKLCLNLPASQIIHSMNLSPRGIGICYNVSFQNNHIRRIKKAIHGQRSVGVVKTKLRAGLFR